ncbi:MAG: hypothetical protein AB1432_15730 [Bacteroidota bacterium]
MATLTIELKQHTPIIHFQPNQTKAFLRISEVKPKLDRFLVDHFNKNKIAYKEWLIGKSKIEALNYSMKICDDFETQYYLPMPINIDTNRYNNRSNNIMQFIKSETGIDITIIYPTPFFANADKLKFRGNDVDYVNTDLSKLSLGLYTKSKIDIIIKSWDNDLLEKIKENIASFFLCNNFGTRQDKGFGSFSVESIDNKTVKQDKQILSQYFFKKSKTSYTNLAELYKFILNESQQLKGGKNHPRYEKSELFNYFIGNGVRWEKRFIKQGINQNKNKLLNKELYWKNKSAPIDIEDATNNDYNDWFDKQNNTYKYVRALLGLAEHFEFDVFKEIKDENGNWIKINEKDNDFKYIVTLEHKPKSGKPKIERFPSPILFKVLNGYVYLGINNTYEEILGEEFNFKLSFKKDARQRILDLGSLKIPDKFDLKDFLEKHLSKNWVNI